VLDDRVRRLTGGVRWRALALSAALAACADDPCAEPEDALDAARAYQRDACVRRSAMVASVSAADTPYGELRLTHYALAGDRLEGEDWDTLPVFDRSVRRLRVRDGTAPDAALETGSVVSAPPSDLASYVAAGADAFDRYPIQIDLGLAALRDRATAERTGLSVDEGGLVRGVVEVETSTGWNVSLTCAACHARDGEDGVVLAPNEHLDLGALFGHDDWPVGTIDVTDDGVSNPIRPSDLRPIAHQARLQHTGNLFNGRVARMARIETLMITQLGERFRPPREIVAAIALFLEAQGDALPRPDAGDPGAVPFAASCSGCHRGEGLSGPPVSAASVGTDPVATTGGQRGTGAYRAPSLLGVADRRGVFHDGSAADLRAVLGLSPSDHRGHGFGRALDDADREAIASYLSSR
jgi:mono/diheme cytochrome c family protein